MVLEQVISERKKILPWDGELIYNFYKSPLRRLFSEQFFELIQESYKCFLYDCPRASIIMSAEALLRVLYDQTILLIEKEIPFQTKFLSLNHKSCAEDIGKLEKISYQAIIDFLEKNSNYSHELIKKIRVIQDIRNKSAHRELPIIGEWDPEDPRPKDEFIKMLTEPNYEFPEGYMIYTTKEKNHWYQIDLREYDCGSIKNLSWQDKIAIIQYLSVLDILNDIYV